MNNPTKDLQFLDLQGNVIPHNWFNSLRMDNGSPDYQSIIILSEIVYWYRPTVKFNTEGIAVGYKKKYKDDILQKSYDDLSKKFGMTKRQVRDSVVRLEERGLIKRIFRNLIIKGSAINNVLYIDLYVDKLKEVTVINDMTNSNTKECSNPSYDPPNQGYTNTDITTDIKKDLKDNGQNEFDRLFKQQFDDFWKVYYNRKKKEESFKSFVKAVKKHGIEKVMNGTYEYIKVQQHNGTEKKYLPHPTTFLNQAIYLDDMKEYVNQNNNNNRYNPYAALQNEFNHYKEDKLIENDNATDRLAIPENVNTLF